ncbi:hypothetical protein, partial [Rhizobium indigoferae]|uniref:hypothetical protein n=1 Tax=Rhizobium indigoferae TaxID=158891 RepID=UPI001AEDB716
TFEGSVKFTLLFSGQHCESFPPSRCDDRLGALELVVFRDHVFVPASPMRRRKVKRAVVVSEANGGIVLSESPESPQYMKIYSGIGRSSGTQHGR